MLIVDLLIDVFFFFIFGESDRSRCFCCCFYCTLRSIYLIINLLYRQPGLNGVNFCIYIYVPNILSVISPAFHDTTKQNKKQESLCFILIICQLFNFKISINHVFLSDLVPYKLNYPIKIYLKLHKKKRFFTSENY